ncbi:Zinc finger A20 and AN1 domain-containing stress-associated protein 4 [Forsythia ovata]|uniref:Zinc finger A20 and AN1 domain-containing stress-associated protein 4 n=1 Tax=Forsythia ovata TaxID=205694 RepID=A0ABD1WYS3_9LAMI
MAEEQKCQEPAGGHRLCANNCGFFGSPTTLNLCSKCYKDYCVKEQEMRKAKIAMEKTLNISESSSFSPPSRSESVNPIINPLIIEEKVPISAKGIAGTEKFAIAMASPQTNPNRCAACRKRVGLTGFKCRCGVIFCGSHRYPEQHDCTFDYKQLGRVAIAKANPVVKAEKLDKI